MRPLGERLRDERGIAVIVALLVSMVVVMLGITSVTLAIHGSESSAFDRRRVQAIAAAEAGLNWYFSHLQSVPSAEYACSMERDIATTPPTHFAAGVTFYDASSPAAIIPCGAFGGVGVSQNPSTALIESEGNVVSNAVPTRTMQAYVEISSIGSGPISDTSIFSDTGLSLPSNVKLYGRTGNDASVYSNGNVSLSGNDAISGDVIARGTVTMGQQAQVKGDVVAAACRYPPPWPCPSPAFGISMKSSSTILGSATASASSITVQQNKLSVYGTAQAGTTITATGSAIPSANRIENDPSDFPDYDGDGQPGRAFPDFEYEPTAWTGYNISTPFTDCGAAQSYIEGLPAGTNNVVRITGDCNLELDGEIPLSGDLAIISDGSLSVGNNTSFVGDGLLHSLYLVFGFDKDGNTGSGCNMTFGSGSTFDVGLLVMLHTPCTISLGSSALILEGQVIGGTVTMKPGSALTYRPIPVPGMASGTPAEDIRFIREIVTAP